MITYILKSSVLLLILFVVYKLWLENEKMFRFNRVYLLGSLLFSLIIPLQLFSFDTKIAKAINSIQLPEMVLNNNLQNPNTFNNNQTIIYGISGLYLFIVLLLTIRFVLNLYAFHKKIKYNESLIINNQKAVLIQESILPHSFLNTIFINENDLKNDLIDPQLITHETAHIEQKHSFDIIFIELIQILLWFNPIILLYKKAIKLNHEFLADEAVITQLDSVSYYQNLLLKMASNQSQIALASAINFQITKKRLLMMTKQESRLRILLKTAAVGFVFAMLFFAFSNTTIAQGNNRKAENEPQKFLSNSIQDTTQPEYPGGINEFYKFIGKNFKVPEEVTKNKIKGKVYIQFFVERDGSLSDFTIKQDLGYGLGDEAIRVIKLSPKWKPGTINNEPAKVMYDLPITVQSAPE
ncbi:MULTISPECIES: M56 family metallopeptidase [unclassified Flavobacterium]|uniref:M56 family metallopeptidase n=1 Tax=unclassified Flavobacterium TaxID=196869 RepID=UPI001E349735|nr:MULTISPECIES: M56 family metallopeptidase [unclassified Flavobacterium]MCD0474517.1 M56 family metallopeptidase [Flavobacterium sp. EDS]